MISGRKAKHLDATTMFIYILSCKHSSQPIRAGVLSELFYKMLPSLSSNQQPSGQKTRLFELYARKVLVILAYDQLIGQACYITVIVNIEVII